MAVFNRRTYSIRPFWTELLGVARDYKLVPWALGGLSPAHRKWIPFSLDAIEPALRERIMLAVTGVNDCRYCRFIHTRIGLFVGLARLEAAGVLAGDFSHVPEEERPALEFARRWAERNAEEDLAETENLVRQYGQPTADRIMMCCRLIRLGNLSGNTLDLLLFRMSGARIGA